jgi:hypothetical protein
MRSQWEKGRAVWGLMMMMMMMKCRAFKGGGGRPEGEPCQQQASRGWRARHEEGPQGAGVGSAAAPLVSGDTGMPAPPTASGLMLARLQAGRRQQHTHCW